MSALDFHHAAAVLIIFVACAVMLWLILGDTEVVKLNVNMNSNLVQPILNNGINVGANKLLFCVIWRSAQSVPLNWDVALLDTVVGRIQPPITAELLGRKVTIIVDGRNHEVEGSVVGVQNLPLCKRDDAPNNRRGLAKIKVMLLFGDSEQQMPAALRDVYAEKRSQSSHDTTD